MNQRTRLNLMNVLAETKMEHPFDWRERVSDALDLLEEMDEGEWIPQVEWAWESKLEALHLKAS